MLIYDESRKVFFQDELSNEVSEILDGRPKAYFEADIANHQLIIKEEVQSQNW